MQKDLKDRADIELLVNHFYDKVVVDDSLVHIFRDFMEMSLAEHLPVIYDFWDSILFGTQTYRGNMMVTHMDLHKRVSLEPKHFEQWLSLWEETVDEHFEGTVAEETKRRARLMKELMIFKIGQSSSSNFIQ